MLKKIISNIMGRVGLWLVARADRLSGDWEPSHMAITLAPAPAPVTIPTPSLPPHAELDELLTERNCPTIPMAPRLPTTGFDIDRRLLPCMLPVALPKGERRVIVVDDQYESVTPPAGSWWARGGSS